METKMIYPCKNILESVHDKGYVGNYLFLYEMCTETCFLHDALTQSLSSIVESKADLLKFLMQYKIFIKLALESISLFKGQQYSKFDPQVGENQCQLRAYIFQSVINNQVILESILSSFCVFETSLKHSVLSTAEFLSVFKKKHRKKLTLFDFLEKENLIIKVNKWVLFLIQCLFLSVYAQKDANNMYVGINYEDMISRLGISKTIGRKIVHKFQISVSKFSCEFICKLSEQTKVSFSEVLLLREMCKFDEEKRYCLPLFFLSETILRDAVNNKKIICFKVRNNLSNKYCYFLFKGFRGNFIHIETPRIYKKPYSCIVFRGETTLNIDSHDSKNSFLKKFKDQSPWDVILANMAIHSQYPGQKLSLFKEMPFCRGKFPDSSKIIDSFVYYKKFALSQGCNIDNIDLFFISHVYVENIENIIKKRSL